MKRMLGLLVILMVIYFGFQIVFRFVENGHIENYTGKTGEYEFSVKEVFTVNKEVDNNYYIEITIDNEIFDLQTFEDLHLSKRVVKDVYYYNNDYKCILPILNDKVVEDIICKSGNTYYHYHDLKGRSGALDAFAQSLENVGYHINNYELNLTKNKNDTVYDNVIDSHYLGIETYKGINTINKKNINDMYGVNIFDTDIYSKSISAFVDKYYIVADYSKQTKFNEFKIIDITNNKITTLKYDYDISLDSTVLGTYNNKVYILDNSTKKEYEIDIKKETIIEVGNTNIGIKILNGDTFDTMNAYEVINKKITFNPYSKTNIFNGAYYDTVYKVDSSDNYYILERVGNRYRVYRSNIQNGINKTYLFETTNKDLLFDKDNVYYRDGKYLKRYNNKNGNQIIIENKELEFNNNIKIGLFTK